jgi:F420-dependent oxidoreductase-like protein
MRFGFKTSPQMTTWDDMLAVWKAADDIEVFESGWNFDHFYPIFTDDPHGPCMEAWVTLTALAQETSRLRIGCMVNGMVYRHPAVFANMAATLDITSGGRLELGVGAGWNEEECEAYGIDLGTLTERFDRFEESLAVLTGLFENDTTDFSGRYFTLKNAALNPKGPQTPHPPICIGGAGEKRTLPLVAKYAQHWNFPGFEPDEFVAKREILHERCADIGRDPSEIMTSQHLVYTADTDLGELAEKAQAQSEVGLDLSIVYLAPPHSPAVLEPLAEALSQVD